ncbi:hypothetical protein COCNU_10G005860 [Cocos nucifera]|uniref:Uncharacterized protein n=1 Tax=Cocos nucifera TaxID=13894 RepID=A0A8K0N8E3_COCNU|nr:hypothetical protein COCNU_10G005860 [Cocos nucifera]
MIPSTRPRQRRIPRQRGWMEPSHPKEEAEEKGHDSVGDLLSAAGVDMNEAEAEVGGEGGLDGAVCATEAEDELPGADAALGSAGKEGEGVDEDGGGGLDPAIGEVGEANVLDGGDALEALLLEERVLEAVDGDHQGRDGSGDSPDDKTYNEVLTGGGSDGNSSMLKSKFWQQKWSMQIRKSYI